MEDELEGSLVLEKLAEIGKVEEFLEAVDGDDLSTAKRLLKQAGVDAASIAAVLSEMGQG
ncbi:MAG: hypothetical protein AB7F86_16835 [Bdellovibrionales bacterium]